MAGFVVFSVLGYMAFKQHSTVDKVATQGKYPLVTVPLFTVIIKRHFKMMNIYLPIRTLHYHDYCTQRYTVLTMIKEA